MIDKNKGRETTNKVIYKDKWTNIILEKPNHWRWVLIIVQNVKGKEFVFHQKKYRKGPYKVYTTKRLYDALGGTEVELVLLSREYFFWILHIRKALKLIIIYFKLCFCIIIHWKINFNGFCYWKNVYKNWRQELQIPKKM